MPSWSRTPRQVELLMQLQDVMAREGFSHLTLDDLAWRLHCSKTTLYRLAESKQELVVAVVKQFFRAATDEVERRLAAVGSPAERVVIYLEAVAEQLKPLSRQFLHDVAGFAPAAAIYRQNTAAAADRVRTLVAEGIDAGVFRPVHAAFTGEVVAATMVEIQRGGIDDRVGLSDSEAYAELASLVVHALTPAAS